jgi:transposase
MIAISLRPFFGGAGPAFPGVIFLLPLALGSPSTTASTTGQNAVGGTCFSFPYAVFPTWSGSAWTEASFVPTNTPPVQKNNRDDTAETQALGRSRGRFSTKLHLVVDALGLPLAFRLTGGNRHELIAAPELIEETKPKCLLADKAYSSKAMRQELARLGCEAVIPCTFVWKAPPPYDREKYKWRKEIE